MPQSTSEVGHAKNMENFADLIQFCSGYGASYNPSKDYLKLPALNTKLSDAQLSLINVQAAHAAFINAVNSRQEVFAPLSKLATRIQNALDASGVPDNIVQDAKTYVRKLKGKRASTLPPTEPGQEPNINSVSQMSFDQRIENFSQLIILLETVPAYTPNEPELQITALKNLLEDMKDSNSEHGAALVQVSNSRLARNIVLYNTEGGLVNLASEVKKYVKSVYGATAPEYKQISGIKFWSKKI
jgi:hypothetical protein